MLQQTASMYSDIRYDAPPYPTNMAVYTRRYNATRSYSFVLH